MIPTEDVEIERKDKNPKIPKNNKKKQKHMKTTCHQITILQVYTEHMSKYKSGCEAKHQRTDMRHMSFGIGCPNP